MSTETPQGNRRAEFRNDVAQQFLDAIEKGTAPWQKPWEAGKIPAGPLNPISGKAYRGLNSWWLESKGFTDPRWLTFKQGQELGARVRKGEKSTLVEYWQWSKKVKELDELGQERVIERRLDRPQVFYANVFNASQFDGIEPYVAPEPSFSLVPEAIAMLRSPGVPIMNDQSDRAFYNYLSDSIHLPPMAAFHDANSYCATALHELAHASGHERRLAREYGPFGSEAYGKEELRAEMASYLVCRELGLAHDPGRHAAYVESWMRAIRDDRNFLFRAARDAETIRTWIMEPERRTELEKAAQTGRRVAQEQNKEADMSKETAGATTDKEPRREQADRERTYLSVPYVERNEAKEAGARWDRAVRRWFAPTKDVAAKCDRWLTPERTAVMPDPGAEFSAFLAANGAVLAGPPTMDGKWHRVALREDVISGNKELNGSYRAFVDGVPNGMLHSFRGAQIQWVSTGQDLTSGAAQDAMRQSAVRAAERAAEREEQQKSVARSAYGIYKNAETWASPANNEYLAKKQVRGYGVKLDQSGRLMVPLRDASGLLWNLQFVGDKKLYMEGGRKQGLFHTIDPDQLLRKNQTAGRFLFVAEGYATAASLYAATREPTCVAFDKENLLPVCKALREQYPHVRLVVACDNDHMLAQRPGYTNVGVEKGSAAAKAVGGLYIVPQLNQRELAAGLSDYNDMQASRGLDQLRNALRYDVKHALHREAPERAPLDREVKMVRERQLAVSK